MGMLFRVLLIMARMVQGKEHLEATRGPMRVDVVAVECSSLGIAMF
jgi:hypothetical protein